MRRAMGVILACAAAWLASCGSSAPPPKTESSQPPKQYKLHGEIVALESDGHIAKIRHQDIVGYMKAMTMEFPVKDPAEYDKLHTGECINATVYVQDLQFWVGDVQPAPPSKDACVAAAPAP